MLRKFFTSAHTMDLAERKSVTRWAGAIAGVAVLVIVALAMAAARTSVGADSAWWDAVLQARLVLVRLVLAAAIMAIGYFASLILYHAFAKTAIGRSLVVWKEDDTDGANMHGYKTSNGGFIMAMLFVACIGGLLIGVLR
jgi:hypothetical protein